MGFPYQLLQGLANGTPEQLAEVEIMPTGSALHWESLDADLGVPQLVSGLLAHYTKVRNYYFSTMRRVKVLAKLTAKNQLTLPKSVTNEVAPTEYFDIKVENGQIILTPVTIRRTDAVRTKLAALDLSEQDILDAVAWAREPHLEVL
jgi:hypothetical protein